MPKKKAKKRNNSNFLSIDPGKNCGWAYFVDGELKECGLAKTDKKDEVEMVHYLTNELAKLTEDIKPEKLYIEGVSMWSANPTSVISAQKGNLFSLAYLVGSIISYFDILDIETIILYPKDWKGNMGKEATKKRVHRAVGEVTKNEHILDAIGIGLSVLGKL